MSKLIVKSPYIKNTKREKVSGYMEYIATRENVQINKYLKYIDERPNAINGLFSDNDDIDIKNVMSELDKYEGRVWTHIFSLTKEDAHRLGFDNLKTWRNLIKTNRTEIAKAMNIPVENFRWYAAFHYEEDHPHVHMMAWSTNPKEGYLSKDGIKNIKSKLTNDIFKQEMYHLFDEKTMLRNDLQREAKEKLKELVSGINEKTIENPVISKQIIELAYDLKDLKGKSSYGYLKKELKEKVDNIINEIAKDREIERAYNEWQNLQEKIENYYGEKKYDRKPLSEEKTFHPLKNVVITESKAILNFDLTINDKEIEKEQDRSADYSYKELKEIIFDDSYYLSYRDEAVGKMKKLADKGHLHAQYCMGKVYLESKIVYPDINEAINYLERAAVRDYSFAQYKLSKVYLKLGDTKKAEYWMERCANLNNPYAQYSYGKLLYDRGERKEGKEFLEKSKNQGNEYARKYLAVEESRFIPLVTGVIKEIVSAFKGLIMPKEKIEDSTIRFGDKQMQQEVNSHQQMMGY